MSNSLGCQTIENCFNHLMIVMKNPESSFVYFLKKNGFIQVSLCDEVLNPRSMLSGEQKAERLIRAVCDSVSLDEKKYDQFVDFLIDCGPFYASTVRALKEEYEKIRPQKFSPKLRSHYSPKVQPGRCTWKQMCCVIAILIFVGMAAVLFVLGGYVVIKIAIHSAKMASDLPFEITDCLPSEYLINHFVGRERETEEIVTALDYQTTEVGILNIYGSPGFGKSTISIFVGYRMLEKDINVIYTDLFETSRDEIQNLLAERILECVGEHKEKSFKKLLRWIKKFKGYVLLVLDNCDHVLQHQKKRVLLVLQKIVKQSRRVKVLMTSREVILNQENYFKHYKLEQLSEEASCEFLLRGHKPYKLTNSEMKEIAELTGNVPLALQIVQSLLSLPSTSPSIIIEGLKTQRISTLSPSPTTGINACFNLSYKYLSEEEKDIGQYLSLFPGSFTSKVCIAILDQFSKEVILNSLKVLVERSLLDFYNGRYYFHCLIKDYFFEKYIESGRFDKFDVFTSKYQGHFAKLLKNASNAYNNHTTLKKALAVIDSEKHNFLALFSAIENRNMQDCCLTPNLMETIVDSIENGLLTSRFSYRFLLHLVENMISYFNERDVSDEVLKMSDKQTLYLKLLNTLLLFHERIHAPQKVAEVFVKYKTRFEKFQTQTFANFNVSVYAEVLSLLCRIHMKVENHDEFKYYHPILINVSKKAIETCNSQHCTYFDIAHYYELAGDFLATIQYLNLALATENYTSIMKLAILRKLHNAYRITGNRQQEDAVLSQMESIVPDVIKLRHHVLFKHINIVRLITAYLYDHGKSSIAANLLEEHLISVILTVGEEIDEDLLTIYPTNAMLLLTSLYARRQYQRVVELGTKIVKFFEVNMDSYDVSDYYEKPTVNLKLLIARAKYYGWNFTEAYNEMELIFNVIKNSSNFGNTSKEYWTCCRYLSLHSRKYFFTCYGHSFLPTATVTKLIVQIKQIVRFIFYLVFVQPLDVFVSLKTSSDAKSKVSYLPELSLLSESKDITLITSDMHQWWSSQRFTTNLPFFHQLLEYIKSQASFFIKTVISIFQLPLVRFLINYVSILVRMDIAIFMLSLLEFLTILTFLYCALKAPKVMHFLQTVLRRIYCSLFFNLYGKYFIVYFWYIFEICWWIFCHHIGFLFFHFLIHYKVYRWLTAD